MLLAEQFNINVSKAQEIQASIWELPQLSAELNAINPNANTYFDIGKSGQKSLQIDQIIYLGNKKKYEVELAKANTEIAELQFKDLLRHLKLELRNTYYSLYFNGRKIEQINAQIKQLDTLIYHYKVQVDKKNIATKDLLRLQSLYINLNNSFTSVITEQTLLQSKLKLLCQSDSDIIASSPNLESLFYLNTQKNMTLDSLLSYSKNSRPDYLCLLKSFEADKLNLLWQKSLSIPDIRLGASYDQRGGAFNNQVGLTIGIPLNFWNPNKGNILEADFLLKQKSTVINYQTKLLESEVDQALKNYQLATDNLKMLDNFNLNNFLDVYEGYVVNFQKRNISLLEFIDFMESFNQTITQFNEIRLQYVVACQKINTTVGQDILK